MPPVSTSIRIERPFQECFIEEKKDHMWNFGSGQVKKVRNKYFTIRRVEGRKILSQMINRLRVGEKSGRKFDLGWATNATVDCLAPWPWGVPCRRCWWCWKKWTIVWCPHWQMPLLPSPGHIYSFWRTWRPSPSPNSDWLHSISNCTSLLRKLRHELRPFSTNFSFCPAAFSSTKNEAFQRWPVDRLISQNFNQF